MPVSSAVVSGASIGAGADLTELQGCAMWLLLTLVLGSPMHHARAQRALGAHFLVELCVHASHPHRAKALRVPGLFGLQKLSARSSAVRRDVVGRALDALVETIQSGDADLQLMALHALMNVSTEPTNRLPICKAALTTLLAQSRDHAAPTTTTNFVLGVLTNISKDPECKKIMVRSRA